MTKAQLDAVAVTYALGLIGAVLVGVNFARGCGARRWTGLLIPVHHIRGHIAANYLAYPELEPLFYASSSPAGIRCWWMQEYTKMKILGGTGMTPRAKGASDKVARVLGMPYPAVRSWMPRASRAMRIATPCPRIRLEGNPCDMSFSGLKTAAINQLHHLISWAEPVDIPGMCASFSKAVSDMLVPRTMRALAETGHKKAGHRRRCAANSPHPGDL